MGFWLKGSGIFIGSLINPEFWEGGGGYWTGIFSDCGAPSCMLLTLYTGGGSKLVCLPSLLLLSINSCGLLLSYIGGGI